MSKKPKTNSKKQPAKDLETKSAVGGKRLKKLNLKKVFRRSPKPPVRPKKISGSFRLLADSLSTIRQHWKLFSGMMLVYLVLSLLLVGGLGGEINVAELRDDMAAELGKFAASLTIFSQLLGSAGSAGTEVGSAYQAIIIVVVSLAVIWSLRQLMAGEKIGLRDAFYKGMYPLVPFILVLMIIGLQLLPLAIGGFLFNVIISGQFAVNALEVILWSLPVILLSLISVYFICSSIFALYIVTLPDVRPMAALRSARKLVRGRRFGIIRKLIFLLAAFVLLAGLLAVPVIMFVPAATIILFILLGAFGFVFAHVYIYSLYRELL